MGSLWNHNKVCSISSRQLGKQPDDVCDSGNRDGTDAVSK